MADGKWIENLTANTPLTEAAQQVLLARLQVIRNYLPKVLHDADQDPEYVHQLRVGTRRADAALRIFGPCLPDKVSRSARKRLQHIRRAAGVARDLDVFALHLLERQQKQPDREQPGLDYLVGHTLGQRTRAQTELVIAARKDGGSFEDFLRDLILAVRPSPDHFPNATLLGLSRPLLSTLVHCLEEKAGGDLTDYLHLHEVRIAGKRLRYAMEVFACCFGPVFRQSLYPRVEELQEILGAANDSYVVAERIKQVRLYLQAAWPDAMKRLAPGIDATLQFHRKRLPAERRRFVRWWKRWQADGVHQLKHSLLAGAVVDSHVGPKPRN